jgi:hypothetical protein
MQNLFKFECEVCDRPVQQYTEPKLCYLKDDKGGSATVNACNDCAKDIEAMKVKAAKEDKLAKREAELAAREAALRAKEEAAGVGYTDGFSDAGAPDTSVL